MIIINHEKVEPNKFWVKMDAQFFFAQMSDDAQILSRLNFLQYFFPYFSSICTKKCLVKKFFLDSVIRVFPIPHNN